MMALSLTSSALVVSLLLSPSAGELLFAHPHTLLLTLTCRVELHIRPFCVVSQLLCTVSVSPLTKSLSLTGACRTQACIHLALSRSRFQACFHSTHVH